MSDVLLTREETARLLGHVSLSLIDRAIRDRRLLFVRLGRRVFFEKAYLLRRIGSGEVFERPETPAEPPLCRSRRPK